MTEEAPAVDTGAILAANHAAADFFRMQLVRPDNPGPREYLCGRGFEQLLGETRWTVGYAPGGWTSLTSHLLATGVLEPVLEAAGLSLRTRNGRLIDRFRDRLTFGIRDEGGRLVGFTARCAPGCGSTVPKYLNTPHTAIYDKSAELFGLGEATARYGEQEEVVLVEGPLDALAVDLASVGIKPAAAPLALCGTAMSRLHAEHVTALDPRTVVVALDTDFAGCHGSERAYELLCDADVPLLAPALPQGDDPAGCLARFGAERLGRDMNYVRPLADHLVDARLASWADVHASAERELCCLRETASLAVRMRPDEVARQARRMSEVLDLPVLTVTRELIEAIAKAHDVSETTANTRTGSTRAGPSCALR